MIIFHFLAEKMIGSFQHSVGNRIRKANKRHTLEKAKATATVRRASLRIKKDVVFPMKNNVS